MNQYFKTMRLSPFAYFVVTLVITYLLWALLPDETQLYMVESCKDWWGYLTDQSTWNGMWDVMTDKTMWDTMWDKTTWEEWWNMLTTWLNNVWVEYTKYVGNKLDYPQFNTLK